MANMVIGKWRKQPSEVLRYEVDWSKWVMKGETLTRATIEILVNSPLMPLEVTEPFFLSGQTSIVYFLRGGYPGASYQLTHRVNTTLGQTAEREILYTIREA